jgi:hypothetical protein
VIPPTEVAPTHGFFIITNEVTGIGRKVYCPLTEIEAQLGPDESYESADPTKVGFGVTDTE